MKELEGEEDDKTAKVNTKSQKEEKKANDTLHQRLVAKKKAQNRLNKGSGEKDDNYDDEIYALQTFAKGGCAGNKKR